MREPSSGWKTSSAGVRKSELCARRDGAEGAILNDNMGSQILRGDRRTPVEVGQVAMVRDRKSIRRAAGVEEKRLRLGEKFNRHRVIKPDFPIRSTAKM
jgi:hypothetical protein